MTMDRFKILNWGILFLLLAVSFSAAGSSSNEVTAELSEYFGENKIHSDLKKVLSIQQETGTPSLVSFYEERRPPCDDAPCPVITKKAQFQIVSSQFDGCGSRIYQAFEMTYLDEYPPRKLRLADHSTRICDDIAGDLWWINLTSFGEQYRIFKGTP